MTDSCSPRKLDPGLAQTYSKPSALMVSTMKSEPARPPVSTSGSATLASAPAATGAGCPAGVDLAAAAAGAAMAALTAAARLMNSRLGKEKRDGRFIDAAETIRLTWPTQRFSLACG